MSLGVLKFDIRTGLFQVSLGFLIFDQDALNLNFQLQHGFPLSEFYALIYWILIKMLHFCRLTSSVLSKIVLTALSITRYVIR